MSQIKTATYTVDIEWDKNGHPVIYAIGHGSMTTAKEAIEVVRIMVDLINTSNFQHVCSVYNTLDMQHIPFLGRFIRSGGIATTQRTAHIVVGTTNQAIRLVASLMAVAAGKRLRTLDVCTTQAELDSAVAHWLALPERTREYTIDDV
jgi:hypothetical protein